MLAKSVTSLPVGPGWAFEPKFDGYRILAFRTTAGIEGVVAKRVDQPYRPGLRGWQKIRTRVTAEAVIGGVLGPLHTPTVLLLGRYDAHGTLHLAGRTTELTRTASAAVADVIRPQL